MRHESQFRQKAARTNERSRILGLALFLLLVPGPLWAQESGTGWPRTIRSDGELVQVYQPQAERWEGGKLKAREAVVITRKDLGQPIYGVVSLTARTNVNQTKREVTLYDIEVKDASFPSASDGEAVYIETAEKALAAWNFTIELDRLLAELAITEAGEKTGGESFNTTPPKIFVRTNPALLVLIDGEPVLKKVDESGLMRIINSPAVIVFDPATGSYFLEGDPYWMTTGNLTGSWTRVENPPPIPATVIQKEEPKVGKTEGAKPARTEAVPEIIVSMEPAELVQLQGEAQYSPIDGTKLLYVTNTDGDLFLNVPDQQHYLLLSGRWFRAKKLDGPWEFLPGAELPADFARIPPGHPKGTVLASVPGTLQARDAVVAAEVPQTATVDRKKATFTPTYDGEPRFKPIEGTNLAYAENSPNDILRLKGKYYAVSDGVWFVSDDPLGPWTVCDFVPPEIYSVPPTSPLYHVKYVYVYDSTPDFVYVGYLPGYFGAFIWDGTVVYGTGFSYPCWAFNFWYGWPWTWGFGWHYIYWGWGFHWRPWYPYPRYWYSWRRPGWGYGWWNRRILYNRSISRTAAQVSLQNRSVYDRWNAPAVVSRRPVSLRPSTPGLRPQSVPGRTIPGRPDLYAGQDGRVYQHRNDGWYRRDAQKWQRVPSEPVQPPLRSPTRAAPPTARPQPAPPRAAPPRPHALTQQLDRERQARVQGQARVNQYRSIRPPAAPRPAAPARPSGPRPH